jgi:probable HAF family extracellular repeat protein
MRLRWQTLMRSLECVAAQCIMPIAVVCAGDGVTAQIPCRYEIAATITTPSCGIFGPSIPIATAISPNGEFVVGYFYCFGNDERGFVYRTATNQFSVMPMPAGFNTCIVHGVNDAGLAVGKLGGVSISRGFIFDVNSTQYVTLLEPVPFNGTCDITAINASGTVCGFRSLAGPSPDYPTSAFVWSAEGGLIDLGLINGQSTGAVDLNDNEIVTGNLRVDGSPHPFLWSGDRVTDLGTLVGSETYPWAININNHVVGQSAIPPSTKYPYWTNHAIFWNGVNMLDLGTLPGDNRSVAKDINASGTIVGLSRHLTHPGQVDHGFVWHDGVMHNLAELVTVPPGTAIIHAGTITDAGLVIAFTSIGPQFVHSVVLLVPVWSAPGDVDGDCRTDIDDLLLVINEWGQTKSFADLNLDGSVNMLDLLIVLENWTG